MASKETEFKLNEWRDVDSPYVEGLPKELYDKVNSGINEETMLRVLNHVNDLPKDFNVFIFIYF